jgi:hypothetical protein
MFYLFKTKPKNENFCCINDTIWLELQYNPPEGSGIPHLHNSGEIYFGHLRAMLNYLVYHHPFQ